MHRGIGRILQGDAHQLPRDAAGEGTHTSKVTSETPGHLFAAVEVTSSGWRRFGGCPNRRTHCLAEGRARSLARDC